VSLFGETVDELKERVAQALPGMHGWCSKEKAMRMIDLVLEVKPELCVDIGVFGGRSLMPVASALKFLDHGMVVGIDPWNKEEAVRFCDPEKEQSHIQWWSRINFDQLYNGYIGMLSQYQLEDHVVTLRATSELASYAIGEIDIVHIDGNHSETLSNLDVQLYLPKVKQGGYIWFNDCLWGDLQSSVDQLFEVADVIDVVDGGNCILFRKR
jgi:predicted O-methyltransferase YrrM